MIQLQNQFTTAEQAQRLIEAGLPKETADCFITGANEPYLIGVKYNQIAPMNENYLHCWSTGRLIEIMHLTLIPKHRAMFWLNLSKYKINNWMGVMVEFFEQFIKNEFVDLSKLDTE